MASLLCPDSGLETDLLEAEGAGLWEALDLWAASGLETDLFETDGADLWEALDLWAASGLETDLFETDGEAFGLLVEPLPGPAEAYSLFVWETDLLPWSFIALLSGLPGFGPECILE